MRGVASDSMAPAICDRDLVVLDMGRAEPLDDHVFVVLTGEGLVVKRLCLRDDPLGAEERQSGVRIPGRCGPGPNPRSGRVDGATVPLDRPSRPAKEPCSTPLPRCL